MGRLTRPGGWHSHCIDLADHGRREANYLDMLQYSPVVWWLTMRYSPVALNRWRACHHLQMLKALGFNILYEVRELRESLPVPLHQLSRRYRGLNDEELRTTRLDVVARKAMA